MSYFSFIDLRNSIAEPWQRDSFGAPLAQLCRTSARREEVSLQRSGALPALPYQPQRLARQPPEPHQEDQERHGETHPEIEQADRQPRPTRAPARGPERSAKTAQSVADAPPPRGRRPRRSRAAPWRGPGTSRR